MVKRSHRRRPVLPPISFRLHTITIRSTRRVRMARRAGQIQRRSSQQQPKVNTAHVSGPFSPQPSSDSSVLPDELKGIGAARLRPVCDLNDPKGLQEYKEYLEWFYDTNKGPGPAASKESIADAASKCLEEEKKMSSLWKTKRAHGSSPCEFSPDVFGGCLATMNHSTLSKSIIEVMHYAIDGRGASYPLAVDAAACIAKEAELITEWLMRRGPVLTDQEYTLCRKIRLISYDLFNFRGVWSKHIAAALMGIRKEAELLIENLRLGSVESNSTSTKIRQSAFNFVYKLATEFDVESESSDMTSEGDDGALEEDIALVDTGGFGWSSSY